MARLVGGYLTRDGFEMTVAENGTPAVEAARTVDRDVVVLDLPSRTVDPDRIGRC